MSTPCISQSGMVHATKSLTTVALPAGAPHVRPSSQRNGSQWRGFAPLLSVLTLALLGSPAMAQDQTWGYKVKPGDKLVDIAKDYMKKPGDWERLQKENGVLDPKRLQPGTQIGVAVDKLKQGEPSAEAALVHGEVQKLDASGKSLGKLSSGDKLTMGDTIQTGARSTLTIRFADDSRMLVTENSKITLASLVNYGKTGMADTKVQVHSGGTDSQVTPQKGPGAKYEVKTPVVNLAVRGTGFRIRVDESSGLTRAEVSEGAVAAQGDGSNALIPKGFGLVGEAGKPIGKPVALLPPPNLAASQPQIERIPLGFEWQPLGDVQNYRLQLLALVAGREAIIFDDLSPLNKVQWEDLPNGDYQLRVRGVDTNSLEGENAVRPFRVFAHPQPPELVAPAQAQSRAGGKVAFKWEPNEEVHQYLFELAEDAAFTRPVAKVPNIPSSSQGILLPLPSGQYFWRVASLTERGELGPYSDVFSFSLNP